MKSSLYKQILHSNWDALPHSLQDMHDDTSSFQAKGVATVASGKNPLAKLVAYLFKFPSSESKTNVSVNFEINNDIEIWHRTFGKHTFKSKQYRGKNSNSGLLIEQFGWFRFALELVPKNQKLFLYVRRWSFLNIPMPGLLAPKSEAHEYEQDGKFHFDVKLSHPICGMLVHYKGWLVKDT